MGFREEIHAFFSSVLSYAPKQSAQGKDFIPIAPDMLEFLKKIDMLYDLKPRMPRGREDVTRLTGKSDEQLAGLLSDPDIKDKIEQFFNKHRDHPDQRERRYAYSRLFKEVGRLLEHDEDPGVGVWEWDPEHKHKEKMGDYSTRNATLVNALKLDRPVVVYAGGVLEFSEKKDFIDRAFKRIERLLEDVDNEVPYRIYGLTYANSSGFYKTSHINAYNHDPFNFESPQATEFTREMLRPLFTRNTERGEERFEDIEAVRHNFSMLTFVGYSYGTVFVQEIRNALIEEMRAVGYRDEEIKSALPCVHALNLGSCCEVVDKGVEGKLGNFTQVHMIAREDRLVNNRTKNEQLFADEHEPFPHVRFTNQLLLGYRGLPKKAAAVSIEPRQSESGILFSLMKLSENGAKAEEIQSFLDEKDPGYDIIDRSTNLINGHHPVGYMRANKQRSDGVYTAAAHPGSNLARKFLAESVKSAAEACDSNACRENGSEILERLSSEYLTPEEKGRTILLTRIFQRAIEEIPKTGRSPIK